ncbi:hypothetical protein [Cohnella herbarum]|nr:hypothetical protein [Cohnella herbarum]
MSIITNASNVAAPCDRVLVNTNTIELEYVCSELFDRHVHG